MLSAPQGFRRVPATPGALARMRRLLPAAAALAAACSGLPGLSAARAPVTFGLPIPLTSTDGQPDVYGELSRDGAELARDQINAKGGAGGHRIQLAERDDKGDDEAAIDVAKALAADPSVIAVIGHVYSSTTMKAAPTYTEGGVAAVATSATNPEISTLGPWIFRLASDDSVNAVQLAHVARGIGPTAEVMYTNEDYGRGLSRAFIRSFTAEGGRITGDEPYLDDVKDLTPFAVRLRQRNPSTVLLAGSTAEGAARIEQEARRAGVTARFIGGDGIESMNEMGAEYDGTLIGVLFHPDQSPRARQFYDAFRAKYHKDPDSSAALAYDAVYLLAAAVEAGNTDRASIREWLARVGQPGGPPALEGAAGRIAFDANGDPLGKTCVVVSIQNGKNQLYGNAR
jgi:branched-chain amino acid transport system substrate-binding protein